MLDNLTPSNASVDAARGAAPRTGDRGCVFLHFGDDYALRLLVSIFTLREVYDGPITVFLLPQEAGGRLQRQLSRDFRCDVRYLSRATKSWDRHRLFMDSPYDSTLSFDSDLIFTDGIDELWEPLEREGVLVTRFHTPPYGVEGSAERPGWPNRMKLLRNTRELVDTDTYTEAVRRMLEDRIDINIGVMGISRPRGHAFLADWAEGIERGRAARLPLLDEMLTVALLPNHRHFLADERWNCPADEFFRCTNLADARVIHYFADGRRVLNMRLGRNPATWAGKKWYEAYHRAARRIDLRHWARADRMFSGRLERLLSHGSLDVPRLVTRSVGRKYRSMRKKINIRARSAWNDYLRPVQRAALSGLYQCGYRVRLRQVARVTVVVLSYQRPANIAPIARSALLCRFVDRVIISNNNPDVDLLPLLNLDDPRLVLLQQERHRGPSFRYDLALAYPSEYYLCIDDDVFPSPWQLRQLIVALQADPSSPRGPAAHMYDGRKNKFIPKRGSLWPFQDRSQPVDVILWVYAFTRRHLERYFELLDNIGLDNESIHSSEDVLISFTGTDRPVMTDIGHVFQCSTSNSAGVATHLRASFRGFRGELFELARETR